MTEPAPLARLSLLGLRTTIYPAPDLDASKRFFTELLGVQPYFDESFYVGFTVAGYELGLDPHADPADGALTYWGVADAADAHDRLVAEGAASVNGPTDVGDGIRVALVRVPGGVAFGVIENPHFQSGTPTSQELP